MKKILYFYGQGCPDCARVMSWVERLGSEDDLSFECLEVWNDAENEGRKQEYADLFTEAYGRATIVPAFVDVENQRVLCNPGTFDELKEWACCR